MKTEPYTLLDYHIDRWVGLFRWMSNISKEALRIHTAAKEYESNAAEDSLKSDMKSIVGAQKESFPSSYPNYRVHVDNSDPDFTFSFHRDNTID